MAKKSASSKGKGKSAPKEVSADDHRKMASQHSARSRLHSAKADLIDAKNPPKKGTYPGTY